MQADPALRNPVLGRAVGAARVQERKSISVCVTVSLLISGIILAAGLSERMGRTKQDVVIGGMPMLKRVVDLFLRSEVDKIVVVVRPGLAWVPSPGPRLKVVINPSSAEGISSSLKLGLKTIDRRSRAAVIGLGDKPLVKLSTIHGILSVYGSSGSRIVIPTYKGKRGNPVLIDRALFAQLLKLKGDVGAKSVIERNEDSVLEMSVGDEGVVVDIDTPADIGRAEELLAARRDLERGEAWQ